MKAGFAHISAAVCQIGYHRPEKERNGSSDNTADKQIPLIVPRI